MADSPEEIQKAIRKYLIVGGILFIGTVVTVLVATVPALDIGGHGFDMYDCVLGLAIAATKASFVAVVFMHLNDEKKAIYWIFLGSLFFCACLYLITAWTKSDPIHDHRFYGDKRDHPEYGLH